MPCPAEGQPRWYRNKEILQAEITVHGGRREAALAHGVKPNTLHKAANDLGLAPELPGPKPRAFSVAPDPLNPPFLRLAEGAGVRNLKPFKQTARRWKVVDHARVNDPLKRLFFLSDVHIPYHDRNALSLVLEAMQGFQPDVVVSMGDFIDCFSVSRYSKDPRRALRLDEEVEQANAVLDEIDRLAPDARRIYIAGNHEDRLQRYLQDKAPELFSFIDLARLLRLEARGWEYVPYKKAISLGKLNLTHDVGSAGRYNVYRALDAYQSPVVTGHTHRIGYVVEGDATGDCQVSAQFGWLGDIEQVDYMHEVQARRNWALGFGVGYLEEASGYGYLTPVPIVGGTCVVEGRLYGQVAA